MLFTDFSGAGAPLADLALAVAVYHKLDQHYPGHNWRVNADHETGLVTVQLLYLDKLRHNAKWGYVIKIASLANDPTYRAAVTAGGELLERFRLRRGPAQEGSRQRAVDNRLETGR